MNRALAAAFDELLGAEPSMTFFEAQSELLRQGMLEYSKLQDLSTHAELFRLFQRAKDRANMGRYNRAG